MNSGMETKTTLGTPVPALAVRVMAVGLIGGALTMPWVGDWTRVVKGQSQDVEGEPTATLEVIQLRPALVRVPAGTFWMGSPENEPGRFDNEGPRRQAKVAAFEVCRTEVTQAQWEAVLGTTPFDRDYGVGARLPAQNITWNEAVEYLDALTRQENELRAELGEGEMTRCYEREGNSWRWVDRACTGFRLPTETEWEYMARADTETVYSFGDDAKDFCRYGNGADRTAKQKNPGWTVLDCDDGEADLAEVVRYEPNPWGLFDVHGNVYEWVWDWYEDAYPDRTTEEGYAGPELGERRVLRGGSFRDDPRDLRSAFRFWFPPVSRFPDFGVRCVRSVPPEPSTP